MSWMQRGQDRWEVSDGFVVYLFFSLMAAARGQARENIAVEITK